MFKNEEMKIQSLKKIKQLNDNGNAIQVDSYYMRSSINRSVYGVFYRNFKMYNEIPERRGSVEIYKKYFKETKILTEDY